MEKRAAIPVTPPRANPTVSYWQNPPDALADHRTTPELPSSADTVIIGSGITGAAVAWHLLEAGCPGSSILILEARQACSGATGRNAANISAVHAFARTHRIPGCDSHPCDTIDVIYDPAQWAQAVSAVQAMRKAFSEGEGDAGEVEKVLDIGTGTGIWAMDMADMYPNTTFIGTDISPIQPGWVPPNLFFEHEDMAQPWSFADNSFDFVHMRYLFGAVRDWNQLFQEAYRVCKPGGYIETVESDAMIFAEDGSIAEGSPIEQWGKMFGEAGKKIGRSFLIIGEDVQRKGLEAAGFKDLVQWDFNCPTTPWSKDKKLREIGRFNYAAGNKDLEGEYPSHYCICCLTVYLALLRKQLRDRNVHPVAKLRVIYAQKPSDAPAA
ncbi:hypothetical protein N0V88_007692 [Collariella sp. IMI 366227]|nr:hypothetical protein N0V88_007692 [Collariella sp. IMI 366227]